jgi:hypothetical protein
VSTTDTQRAEFDARCNTIEEAYEFFLAYASQGLPSDQGSATGQQVREHLKRCDEALKGLGPTAMALVSASASMSRPIARSSRSSTATPAMRAPRFSWSWRTLPSVRSSSTT